MTIHPTTAIGLLSAADALDEYARKNPRYAKAIRETAEHCRRQAKEALDAQQAGE